MGSLLISIRSAYRMQAALRGGTGAKNTSASSGPELPSDPGTDVGHSMDNALAMALARSDISLHERVVKENVQLPWPPAVAAHMERIERFLQSHGVPPVSNNDAVPRIISPANSSSFAGLLASTRLAIRFYAWSGQAQRAVDAYKLLVQHLSPILCQPSSSLVDSGDRSWTSDLLHRAALTQQ